MSERTPERTSELNRVFTSASPWIVGREALFEDAVEDFLHETTRRKPWLRARFEAQLEDLNAYLDRVLDGPAPLKALSRRHANAWLHGLSERAQGERSLAERALTEFADYLVKWGWLPSHPLNRPPTV